MVEENNQNVFLIHKDASNFAKFEISEFEISRVDCICPFPKPSSTDEESIESKHVLF